MGDATPRWNIVDTSTPVEDTTPSVPEYETGEREAARWNVPAGTTQEADNVWRGPAGPGVGVSVEDYGAVGDGVHDDTVAIQRTIDACTEDGGGIYFPPGTYLVTDTLTISPYGSNTQVYLNLIGDGSYPNILWGGSDDTSVFSALGWKHSNVRGILVQIPDTNSGVVAWDLDTSAAIGSLSSISFNDCVVGLGTGTYNVGWRMGHVSGGAGDVSFISWHNCMVAGGTMYGETGQVGWLNEGANSTNHYWFGGVGWNLEKMVTNISQTGASSVQGCSNLFVYGLGSSRNSLEFEEGNVGSILVCGGRYEVGKRFYQSATGASTPTFTLVGVTISQYAPDDGILFYCIRSTSLVLDNVRIERQYGVDSPYTSAMFTLGGSGGLGSLIVRGGAIYADDPFYVDYSGGGGGGEWNLLFQAVDKLDDAVFTATSTFAQPAGADPTTISGTFTTSTWTMDCDVARVWNGTMSDQTAISIPAPLNPGAGYTLIVNVMNGQNATSPTITFNSVFYIAGALALNAYSQKVLTFVYNGTYWLETSRTAADTIAAA